MACDLVLSFQAYEDITDRFCRCLPLQDRYVSGHISPIAADLSARHDVHMEMRSDLSGDHAVVLNKVEPFRVVCSHEGIGSPANSAKYRDCLLIRQVEESWGVTPGNNVNLPELELAPVH